MEKKTNGVNLNETLKKLEAISSWFDSQREVDVEEGLKKVKEGAELIKASKARLAEIENEFEEVKKGMADDD
ncbi:MAG: exodeoxyribonuclease VII small subunit [Candidatus Paceibacterota bacterium]|jgi:exonuclease VII small subunit|nr:exodeoxyribonuclease VII small subunit [Candidatus Paceibacterota bacterium]